MTKKTQLPQGKNESSFLAGPQCTFSEALLTQSVWTGLHYLLNYSNRTNMMGFKAAVARMPSVGLIFMDIYGIYPYGFH